VLCGLRSIAFISGLTGRSTAFALTIAFPRYFGVQLLNAVAALSRSLKARGAPRLADGLMDVLFGAFFAASTMFSYRLERISHGVGASRLQIVALLIYGVLLGATYFAFNRSTGFIPTQDKHICELRAIADGASSIAPKA